MQKGFLLDRFEAEVIPLFPTPEQRLHTQPSFSTVLHHPPTHEMVGKSCLHTKEETSAPFSSGSRPHVPPAAGAAMDLRGGGSVGLPTASRHAVGRQRVVAAAGPRQRAPPDAVARPLLQRELRAIRSGVFLSKTKVTERVFYIYL